MITTVTLNPAIDKIVEINDMELGKVHRVSKMVETLGGKSINVARILSGFSEETKAVCFAGEDNYDSVKAHARKDEIPLVPIMVKGSIRTNVKIVEPDQDYRTTDVNEPGFFIEEIKLKEMNDLIKEMAQESEVIVLSGSLPAGVPTDYYKTVVQEMKDITKVIVDADGEILNAAMEAGPYLIKPNIDEFEAALGMTFKTDEQLAEEARKLIDKYDMKYILISMGGDGSLLVGKNIALRAGILKVNVVSTVGAGDSMLAGVIHGLIKFKDLTEEECLKKALSYGVASGAIAIGTQDHVKIEEDLLNEKAAQVEIRELQSHIK